MEALPSEDASMAPVSVTAQNSNEDMGQRPDNPDETDWRNPIIDYLNGSDLPDDDAEADRIARRAKLYVLIEDKLYKKGTQNILMKCIPGQQGKQLLQEIHSGECGSHAASRTLVGKAFHQGLYWPTTLQDAEEMVRSCEACQYHSKQQHQPAQILQNYPNIMALCGLGVGCSRTIPKCSRRV